MKRDTYLSLDLDYWRKAKNAKGVESFFYNLFQLKREFFLVKSHDQLLGDINSSQCSSLINVDFHSDVAEDNVDGKPLRLNEGTWVNFVTWKTTGSFLWLHPPKMVLRRGYCHAFRNPFHATTVSGWKGIKKEGGVDQIPWDRIRAVGISISPAWLDELMPYEIVLPALLNESTLRQALMIARGKMEPRRVRIPVIKRNMQELRRMQSEAEARGRQDVTGHQLAR